MVTGGKSTTGGEEGVGHQCHSGACGWKAVKGGDGIDERSRCRAAVQIVLEFGGCGTLVTNPPVTT